MPAASAMSSTVKLPGPLDRSRANAASVMAWRGAAALGDGVFGTPLHYVHVCTLGNFIRRWFPGPDAGAAEPAGNPARNRRRPSQQDERFRTAPAEGSGRDLNHVLEETTTNPRPSPAADQETAHVTYQENHARH